MRAAIMLRGFVPLILAIFTALPAQAQTVTLRAAVESAGPAVTLGDFFAEAGPVAGRAVGPAPAAGRSATFSARFVAAAANAAGLTWTPPTGLERIVVTGRGGDSSAVTAVTARSVGDIAVRRGEIVTLVYVAPGMQLTARARATADAAVGDPVRLTNLQSNRAVDAVVTGPGAASASASR